MDKKKEKKVTINISKLNLVIKPIFIVIAIWFLLWSFINFFIPIILNMVEGLIASVMLWKVTTNEIIKFFGGIVFLFIGYKIYEVLIGFWFRFFEGTLEYANNFYKQIKEQKQDE